MSYPAIDSDPRLSLPLWSAFRSISCTVQYFTVRMWPELSWRDPGFSRSLGPLHRPGAAGPVRPSLCGLSAQTCCWETQDLCVTSSSALVATTYTQFRILISSSHPIFLGRFNVSLTPQPAASQSKGKSKHISTPFPTNTPSCVSGSSLVAATRSVHALTLLCILENHEKIVLHYLRFRPGLDNEKKTKNQHSPVKMNQVSQQLTKIQLLITKKNG